MMWRKSLLLSIQLWWCFSDDEINRVTVPSSFVYSNFPEALAIIILNKTFLNNSFFYSILSNDWRAYKIDIQFLRNRMKTESLFCFSSSISQGCIFSLILYWVPPYCTVLYCIVPIHIADDNLEINIQQNINIQWRIWNFGIKFPLKN